LIAADREWRGTDGASPELLERLRKVMPADLPPEYFQLLAFSNGGEGPLPVEPYNFCLDEAEYAAKQYADKVFHEYFPGRLVLSRPLRHWRQRRRRSDRFRHAGGETLAHCRIRHDKHRPGRECRDTRTEFRFVPRSCRRSTSR